MVFAAGRGRRMQPLSDVLPKPALPVPGGPVLGWPLRLAARNGVDAIVVNTWWHAGEMERVARACRPPGIELRLSREETLMETAGGLALARDRGHLGAEGPVLVLNGDGVLNLDLEPLFRRHSESEDLVTLGLLPHLGPERWSRVLLDRNGAVCDILPPGTPAAGEVPLLYPGVMVIAREAVDRLETVPSGVASALWNPARSAGRMGGVVLPGHWREVGTPEGYLETVLSMLGDRVEIDPSARVADGVRIERSLIGIDVSIEPGAVISNSVVSHGAVVRSGAYIERTVLLGGNESERRPDSAIHAAVMVTVP